MPFRYGWCRFPHAVLEVKLQLLGENATPPWVTDLINSGMLMEVHKFSKFIHGCAVLLPDEVLAVPYWIDDTSLAQSIRQVGSRPSTSFFFLYVNRKWLSLVFVVHLTQIYSFTSSLMVVWRGWFAAEGWGWRKWSHSRAFLSIVTPHWWTSFYLTTPFQSRSCHHTLIIIFFLPAI